MIRINLIPDHARNEEVRVGVEYVLTEETCWNFAATMDSMIRTIYTAKYKGKKAGLLYLSVVISLMDHDFHISTHHSRGFSKLCICKIAGVESAPMAPSHNSKNPGQKTQLSQSVLNSARTPKLSNPIRTWQPATRS